MNNNKENYKNAINKIHASDKLKAKTLENIENMNSNNTRTKFSYNMLKFLSACAAVFLICFIGLNSVNFNENKNIALNDKDTDTEVNTEVDNDENEKEDIILANAELKRFESMDELKEALKSEHRDYYFNGFETTVDGAIMEDAVQSVPSQSMNSATSDLKGKDYSTTNTQVDNVDEADIVKTDGEYIYYTSNNTLYIVKAETLEIISKIRLMDDDEVFYISEIYLKEDKLVLLGSGQILEEPVIVNENVEKNTTRSLVKSNRIGTVKAVVYDIGDRYNPELLREVALEGSYVSSRMVGDNLYFLSRNYKYYYDEMGDERILPIFNDSLVEEVKTVECTDIIYFENSNSSSFMMVGGFNINDNEEVCVETFFGAGDIVYANEKNLYLTKQIYGQEDKTAIYKFGLDGANIKLIAQTEVDGHMNNQFSMDEYDGNLRVATTSYKTFDPALNEFLGMDVIDTTITTNNLFILNDKLELIGKIEDLAKDEKIYSVRFIGEIGYMVTFKEIDPLFVIDLSDPTNPVVKGELKIPGYSSYLHPYDENHIIGIGYNVKDNRWGGVTNSNMKMSMFDVSDLSNPKEVFNVDIGEDYAYSEITYNHKVLFSKESENLIGFPVTYNDYNYRENKNGFIIFKIDLENNQFEKYGEIMDGLNYRFNSERIIYIEDVLYSLERNKIISYDLNTLEKINEVELPYEKTRYYYEDMIEY